jgi:hypothetical protein
LATVEAAALIESVVVSVFVYAWQQGALTLASQINGDGGTWQYCEGSTREAGQY